jgi:hypothetical protein
MTFEVRFRANWSKWVFLAGTMLAFGAGLDAQTLEVSPFVSYMHMGKAALGSISENNQTDTDTRIGSSRGYGIRLTWNPWKYYGHELSYSRYDPLLTTAIHPATKSTDPEQLLSQKIQIHSAAYNFLIYFMPKQERWRPYVTGGVQAYQYQHPKIENFPTGSLRHYGANYGFGLKIKLVQHLQARLDARHLLGGKPYDLSFKTATMSGGFLQQLEGSFGIGFTF